MLWSRGVDTALFHPRSADLCLPMPVFLSVGRVAVEKNLEAFLDLDLPGTKLIVGDGPARAALERKYPDAVFLGARHGEELAEIYAAADVFVFPSRTDTFGLVLLEALASGVPVAAFPVTGPRDVIGSAPVGVLDEDLRAACLEALQISRRGLRRIRRRATWAGLGAGFCRTRHECSASLAGRRIGGHLSLTSRISSPEVTGMRLARPPASAIQSTDARIHPKSTHWCGRYRCRRQGGRALCGADAAVVVPRSQ